MESGTLSWPFLCHGTLLALGIDVIVKLRVIARRVAGQIASLEVARKLVNVLAVFDPSLPEVAAIPSIP